ncbi:Zinc/iron permease [Neolentinus lepideus HHB14362 ss-1]|uniref:Zinc/iron permease n=1 Tax=Neolentinus lepideus HHB14362 ss-1 TaxID=1314782 RepID=A0A165MU85_9AGAM|nr:Zinc/iron permease [Neolentinus lepideus HHB14362 ss-1]
MPPTSSLILAPAASSRNTITQSIWRATDALTTMRRVEDQDEGLGVRLSVMSVIFVVSLSAASFPTLSRHIKFLRVPRIIFFIGKHFGTGVILSTAFVHLLQDAFAALHDSGRIGDFTGIIVLGSLLSIFLVEYISTSYVDNLQSYSSAPSTPSSPIASLPPSSSTITPSMETPPTHTSDLAAQGIYALPESPKPGDERTPLIRPQLRPSMSQTLPRSACPPPTLARPKSMYTPQSATQSYFPSRRESYYRQSQNHSHTGVEADIFEGGHHRHEARSQHATHVSGRTRSFVAGQLEEELARSEGADSQPSHMEHEHHHEHAHPHHHPHHSHSGHTGHSHAIGWETDDEFEHPPEDAQEVQVGRKRVVVGILVLQLGIMIHSLVIGLTLAITSGGGFTSLVFAIIFHQLFEGLSLGIRIAQMSTSSPSDSHLHKNSDGHNHEHHDPWYLRFLKPTLMALFAMTTPLGMMLGILLFSSSSAAQDSLTLIRGVMCAVSAGMLIYAATVEMLAADFVMDPASWRAGVRRQVVALGSLVAGVVGMSLVGMMD